MMLSGMAAFASDQSQAAAPHITAQFLAREHVLVWTFALTLTFLVMMSTYVVPGSRQLWAKTQHLGTAARLWKLFINQAWIGAAIAITAFVIGTNIRAGWVSSFFVYFAHTGSSAFADRTWEIDVGAGVITVIGLFFMHIQFAPEGYEFRWAYAALVFAACVDAVVWLV